MALKWCQGQITRRDVWTEGLFTLHVQVDGVSRFKPGQFLQVGLNHDSEDESDHLHRPYSVASPWGPTIEFFIVVVQRLFSI